MGSGGAKALKLENPQGLAAPLGAYSHSAEVPAGARLVFISGQVAVGLDGKTPESLVEQAELVYSNLMGILGAKGIAADRIIKLTTFLVEDDTERVLAAVRRKYLGEHKPASTVVGVRRLFDPAWKIEVEAIAMAGDSE